jgi:hypothetical protein
MAYGKGRATSYTDYFKRSTNTPDGNFAEEDEDTILPVTKALTGKSKIAAAEEKKKAAIRRRLAKKKAGV